MYKHINSKHMYSCVCRYNKKIGLRPKLALQNGLGGLSPFLTIYALTTLNYSVLNATLILCELPCNGRIVFSIKVSRSMIWIIN